MGKCLNSVRNQDYPHKEIIVIDDGSTDKTPSYIKKHFPEVKIIHNSKPGGPAFAKNQGIINSNGRYIHFLDSDSELLINNTISNMVKIMNSDKSIGILGGTAELDTQGNMQRVYALKITYDGRSYYISLTREALNYSDERMIECDFVNTCNCFIRRDLLSEIGGFDPYYIYMGEDKEIALKVKRLGYKVLFSFKTACLHKYDEIVKFDRHFMYLKNRLRFVIKNKGLQYFFIIPVLDFFFFFIYYPLFWLLSGIFPNLKTAKYFENKLNPSLKLPETKWILLSGYYFLKAYLQNLREIPIILSCRNANFLSEEKMQTYRKFKGLH